MLLHNTVGQRSNLLCIMNLVKSAKGWRRGIERVAGENIKACFVSGPLLVERRSKLMLEIGDTLIWVISGPQQLGRAFKSATHLGQHRAGIIPSPSPVPSFPVLSRSFCLQSLRRLPGCPSLWMHTFPSRRFGSVLIKASPFICGDNWTFISPGCCSQIYSLFFTF